MTILGSIGNSIDKIVGVFSPRSALERKFYRESIEKANARSLQYAAAKTNRLTGPWSPLNADINTFIKNSSSTIRARVRQLVRDFPYFVRAVNVLCDYTVGSGIIFQSRIKDETDNEKLNKKLIQQVEDAFNFWADESDIAGKLHYYEMMELAKRQDLEGGEFLIVKRYPKNTGKYLPFALQMIEADWLTDYKTNPTNSANAIDQGIEYDKTTGQHIAYHFTDPDSWGKPITVMADDVIHGFKTLRPGQIRGISPFAAAILVAHDLSEYMDTEMDAAKMAAKWLAMVTTPSPYGRQLGTVTTDSDTNQKIEEMENAIIEYLRPGEEVTIANNPRPGTNMHPFVKLILCMVAVTTGAPYELLSGDYGGMNYSTSRTVRNDFSHSLKPIAGRHVRHFGMPTLKPFMDMAVVSGKLNLPGYFINPVKYLSSEWQPPGMESVDPLRESKAMIDQISFGLRSPQEHARARGRDLEDIYKEIKLAQEMAEDMELSFSKTSTATANNPAAVDNQKGLVDEAAIIDLIDHLEGMTANQ